MDYSKADEQKIQSLWKGGFLKRSKLLKYSEFTNSKEADVEDLFDQETYLDLVRNTYQEELIDKEFDVSLSKTGHPRVCKRISEIFKSDNINNGNFQHYSPARYLLLHPEVQTTLYTDEVLERFEKIFVAIKKRILEED